MNTFSLEEAAHIIRGGRGAADTEWLRKRLCAGRLSGYKAGRHWRMTEEDIRAAVDSMRPVALPAVPSFTGMTRTSARRLAS